MNQQLKTTSTISATALAMVMGTLILALAQPTAAAEPQPGHTSHAGDHDFAYPQEKGVELTSAAQRIRLAWRNPIHTGFVKGGSGTASQLLEDGFDPAYGEAASPILADGVLLVSWSQPSGKVTANLASIKDRYFRDEERNQKLANNYYRIDADWHTLALDAENGKTLWRKSERSASMNFLSSKRDHKGISGAARDGLYVTITILGNVHAYDIKTGKTRWTTTLTEWHERAAAVKAEKLEKRQMPHVSTSPFANKRSGAIIVDDIVVLPDLQGGLIGVKTSDGSKVWHTPERLHYQATPRPWKHNGKTYLLCNNARRGNGQIHLIDPTTGKTQWSHDTGTNPGQLLTGEGYLLLNNNPDRKDDALYTCYKIGINGLSKQWALTDLDDHGVEIKADFGAHRKGVIRDGVLYAKLGVGSGKGARMVSIDLKTGKQIHAEDDPALGLNAGQPFIAEDKLYMQRNSAHSGSKSGLYIYQLRGNGRFRYLGEVLYDGLGIKQLTSYEYPLETPYAHGKLYLRGHRQIAAIDLTTVTDPMAEVSLIDAWAGFTRPVRALMFADSHGVVQSARLESPPRKELGIVGTPAYRSDRWTPLLFDEPVELGEPAETGATLAFVPFAWDATISMSEAQGSQWRGTWQRRFPGWDKTVEHKGKLDSSSQGGFDERAWPTPWLKHQPISTFSDLPEGQRRVFLQMHGFTPTIPDVKGPQNFTLCLDYDDKKVRAGIGGAFGYNQSYHEVDCSELVVTDKGIKGSAVIILNPDSWVPGDHRNGGSLAGQLELDVTFGKPDDNGVYSATGDWSVEWGLKMTRSGTIHGAVVNRSNTR